MKQIKASKKTYEKEPIQNSLGSSNKYPNVTKLTRGYISFIGNGINNIKLFWFHTEEEAHILQLIFKKKLKIPVNKKELLVNFEVATIDETNINANSYYNSDGHIYPLDKPVTYGQHTIKWNDNGTIVYGTLLFNIDDLNLLK